MKLLQKFRFYRRSLYFLYLGNALAVICLIVMFSFFLRSSHQKSQDISQLLEQVKELDVLEYESFSISKKSALSQKESLLFLEKFYPFDFSGAQKEVLQEFSLSPSEENFLKIRNLIGEKRTEIYANVQESTKNWEYRRQEILWISALCFLFGVLIPATLIYFLSRALIRLKMQMQRKIIDLLSDWREVKLKDQTRDELWVELALITVKHSEDFYDHALTRFASELAILFQARRAEEKNKTVA